MTDPRHRAREAALQILYHWEVGRTEVDQAARMFFELQWAGAQPADQKLRDFATRLAEDTVARLDTVDRLIAETALHWRHERMAIIDRLILRMAAAELSRGDTPPAVVINEALELARTFSADESVKFVNGMLDAIRKKIENAPL
jgi:N utilization substance protein B